MVRMATEEREIRQQGGFVPRRGHGISEDGGIMGSSPREIILFFPSSLPPPSAQVDNKSSQEKGDS